MKIHAKLFIGMAVLVVVALPTQAALAHAEDSTQSTTNSTPSDSSSETESSTTTTTKLDTSAEGLKTRIEQRKTELKTKLLATEQVRIKGRCKASQAILTGLGQRLDNAAANHTKAYNKVNAKLTVLIPKIKAKGVDTGALESDQLVLAGKITTYETDLKAYQQAVNDLKTMDCVSDPIAFKASLETARTLRQKLSDSAADIRNYVNQTIKPALVKARTDLAQKEGTSTGGNQ